MCLVMHILEFRFSRFEQWAQRSLQPKHRVMTKKSSEHKIVFQDFKRYALSYLHSTNLRIQNSATIAAFYLHIQGICKHSLFYFSFLSPPTLFFISTRYIHSYDSCTGQWLRCIKHPRPEALKFDNYQRYVKKFVGLSD